MLRPPILWMVHVGLPQMTSANILFCSHLIVVSQYEHNPGTRPCVGNLSEHKGRQASLLSWRAPALCNHKCRSCLAICGVSCCICTSMDCHASYGLNCIFGFSPVWIPLCNLPFQRSAQEPLLVFKVFALSRAAAEKQPQQLALHGTYVQSQCWIFTSGAGSTACY